MSTEQIQVQLPDGSVREVARGTTPFEIANGISPRLAAAVVVARVKPLKSRRDRPNPPRQTAVDGAPVATGAQVVADEATSEDAMYGAGGGRASGWWIWRRR